MTQRSIAYLKEKFETGDIPTQQDFTDLIDSLLHFTQKAATNGLATLDNGGKIPLTQLPTSIVGGLSYKGFWNPATNVITSDDVDLNGIALPISATGNKSFLVIANANKTAFTRADFIGSPINISAGDAIISNGANWTVISNFQIIESINGKIGIVVLTKADVALGNVPNIDATLRANHTGTQAISTIVALQAALDAKKANSMATNKLLGRGTAGAGEIEEIILGTNLSLSGNTLNATGGGGAGTTNLSTTDRTATDLKIASSTGASATVPEASTSEAGLLNASDKVKLNATTNTNSGDETSTTVGALINSATAKTTPIDADFIGLMDSAASNILKKLSWANIKATLKTYFDTIYVSGATNSFVKVIAKQTTDGATFTGTTGEIKQTAFLIPANTIQVGSICEIKVLIKKTGTAGNGGVYCYINTSDSLSGATQIHRNISTAASQLFIKSRRDFVVKSATETEYLPGTVNSVNDYNTFPSAAAISNIDWTVDQYFIPSLTLNNSSDSLILSFISLTKL